MLDLFWDDFPTCRGPLGGGMWKNWKVAARHADCGEAGSAASRKQVDRVGRSCHMTLENNFKNENSVLEKR